MRNFVLVQVFIFCLLITIEPLFSQDIDFDVNDTICKNENLIITNNSTDVISYRWDFCMHDLDSVPDLISTFQDATGSFTVDYHVLYDSGVWYGFLTDFLANKVTKITYSGDLNSSFLQSELTSLSSEMSNPYQTKFYVSEGVWVGFTINSGDDHLIRFTFGDGLGNAPTEIADLGNFSVLNNPYGLEIIEDSENFYLVISNNGNNKLVIINFGSSLLNNPSATDFVELLGSGEVSGASRVSFLKNKNEWIGLVCSRGDNGIFRIDLGNTLFDTDYTFTKIADVTFPEGVSFQKEGLNYYAWVVGRDVGFYQLSFGDDVKSTPTVNLHGKLGVGDQLKSYSMVRASPDWYGFVTSRNGGIVSTIKFSDQCEGALASSSDPEPSGVNYSEAGIYVIEATGISSAGNRSGAEDTVVVVEAVAPDIDFTTENECVSSANIFTPINESGDISTYSWDFDGDGTEDSNMESPSYAFGFAGDYEVSLTVSNGSCPVTITKMVSIFEEPVAAFSLPSSSLCTNTELVFTNMSTVAVGASVSWSWDFDGDGEEDSSEESPGYTFTTPGSHTVRLTATLTSGCESITEETFNLEDGPEIGFDWTNNCFGESVEFINSSAAGTGISYNWDFGDGSSTSTAFSPSYTYSTAGDYTVVLRVDDGNCESELSRVLQVNDGDLSDFTYSGEMIENLPVTFEGVDQTFSGDEIITWNWDFGDGASATGQEVSHSYSSPSNYIVTLTISTTQGCEEVISGSVTIEEALYAHPSFAISSEICRDEPLTITNTSVNSTEYQWDFCMHDLDSLPELNQTFSDESASFITDYTVVEDSQGLEYGFYTDFGGRYVRVDYENGFGSSVTYTPLSSVDVELSSPFQSRFYRDTGGDWVGFVINSGDSHLIRVVFGDGIGSHPMQVDDLGDFGSLNSPYGISIIEDSGGYYVVVSNNGNDKLTIVSFGSSLLNTPGSGDIVELLSGEINSLSRLSMIEVSGEWLAFLCSRGDDAIYRLDFGSVFFDTEYSIEKVADVTFPEGIEVQHEGLTYTGWVVGRDVGFYQLSFGSDIKSQPEVSLRGKLGVSDQLKSFSMVRRSPDWYGFVTSRNGGIISTVKFSDQCEGALASRRDPEPYGVYYSESGDYPIELTGYSSTGIPTAVQDTLTVLNAVAPDISFTTTNQCIASSNTFTITNVSGDITSYSWDFDGDGIEDSAEPNPTFQFPAPGRYNVRLTVASDAGCGNFTEQEISIYPEPPNPTFSISATTFCEGSEILFTNTTDDAAWDGLVEYQWTVTELGDTITSGDLSYSFQTAGEKIITVSSTITGCESASVSETITIEASPAVDFQATSVCSGELTSFTNNSDPGTYLWDFGDGVTSIELNPDHLYAVPGTYMVSLSVTNVNSCTTTIQKEVLVSALPVPGFEYSQLCEGSAVSLTDISTVENSSILAWEWYVDDELVSQDANPEIIFTTSGSKTLRLVVSAENGCQASYSESVEVFSRPLADFSSSIRCIGETTTFEDTTPDPDQIASRMWIVDGQLQTGTTGSLSVVFEESGPHEVMLIVDNQDLCTGTSTQTINVPIPPQLDFEVIGDCANDKVIAQDLSVEAGDEIISRTWTLDGVEAGNGVEALLPIATSAFYEVVLSVETTAGCTYQLAKTIEVFAAPEADFDPANDYGVPPFNLAMTNNSSNAVSYTWYVDNVLVSTDQSPTLSFTETGDKSIKLVAQSSEGCLDSMTMDISSVMPEVDLVLNTIQLVTNGGVQQVLMDVSNQSNLPIEQMIATITLDNEFSITENIAQRINVGQEKVISLNLGIPLDQSKLTYLCVSLTTNYNQEVTPDDNENCINIEPQLVIESPYPNPAKEQTMIRAILPKMGDVVISVVDITGQVRYKEIFTERPSGLNSFTYDLKAIRAGTYFLLIQFEEETFRFRIIKQ